MAKKIDRKLNGVDIVEKEFGDFLENGGTIGGNFKITDNTSKPIFTKRYTISNNDVWLRHNVTNNGGYANIVRFAEDSDEGTLNQVGYQLRKNAFGNNLGELSPLTTNTTTLGTSSVMWKDIYLSGMMKTMDAGYTKLPNGIILQWGRALGSKNVVFPINFPTSCLSVIVSGLAAASANPVYVAKSGVWSFNQNGFNIVTYGYDNIGASGTSITNASYKSTVGTANFGGTSAWIAIGY